MNSTINNFMRRLIIEAFSWPMILLFYYKCKIFVCYISKVCPFWEMLSYFKPLVFSLELRW